MLFTPPIFYTITTNTRNKVFTNIENTLMTINNIFNKYVRENMRLIAKCKDETSIVAISYTKKI